MVIRCIQTMTCGSLIRVECVYVIMDMWSVRRSSVRIWRHVNTSSHRTESAVPCVKPLPAPVEDSVSDSHSDVNKLRFINGFKVDACHGQMFYYILAHTYSICWIHSFDSCVFRKVCVKGMWTCFQTSAASWCVFNMKEVVVKSYACFSGPKRWTWWHS